jgi:predicted regulator of Ras-like GTPase activity (Roadblock/LC7/MglB family)
MPPSDAIRRLSDELARDPDSLAFLALARLLAESGRTEAAWRIARRGAERHAASVEASDLLAWLERARRIAAPSDAALLDASDDDAVGRGAPHALLGELLVAPGAVLAAGWQRDAGDRAAAVAAELGAMADRADRAMAHLALGSWRRIVIEGELAVVGVAPALDGLVAAAVPVDAPLGRLTLLLRSARERYAGWRGRA